METLERVLLRQKRTSGQSLTQSVGRSDSAAPPLDADSLSTAKMGGISQKVFAS